MRCSEYRDLMFERLSGELNSAQEQACSEHEQSCVVCRAELADTKWISGRLRAGWPAEEPMPLSLALPHSGAARNWFDVGALWFSRASAAVVMACLIAVVLVRPTFEAGSGSVRIAFRNAITQPAQPTAAGLTAQQVKQLVAAQVADEVAKNATHAQETPARAVQNTIKDPGVTEVALQLQALRRNQATIWQTVQQHDLYLESLWRNGGGGNVQPTSLTR